MLLQANTAPGKLVQVGNTSIITSAGEDPFSESAYPDPFADSDQLSDHEQTSAAHVDKPVDSPVYRELTALQSLNSDSRPIYPSQTQPGGLVSSACIDPYMTAEQERALWKHLNTLNQGDWRGLTLQQLVDLLRQTAPVQLDVEGLDAEAIDPETVLSATYAQSWGTLGSRLQTALHPLKLTFICIRSEIWITTQSAVDDGDPYGPPNRIYDVSPLVDRLRGGIDQLVNSIQQTIDPDSWLTNGGVSVCQPHIIPSGATATTTLLVSAPFATQLQVQCLLDRLNQMTASSPSSSQIFNRTIQTRNDKTLDTRPRLDERAMIRGGF